MIYRSIADLDSSIRTHAHRIPEGTDLIVGVPRSGMLAASVLALHLNCRLTDLQSFCSNQPLRGGSTRASGGAAMRTAWDARQPLVIDDSALSGRSMAQAQAEVAACGYAGRVRFGVVYGSALNTGALDVTFEQTELPRLFEWNLFHRQEVGRYCVDIDGVLCRDPTPHENDDGPRYRAFLLAAERLAHSSVRIGHLVTSRLEKYRPETEAWLRGHGIAYGELHMLDLPSATERRRLNMHAAFKAEVYKAQRDAVLFIESESHQAEEIARRSGRVTLDYGRQVLVRPPLLAELPVLAARQTVRIAQRLRRMFA